MSSSARFWGLLYSGTVEAIDAFSTKAKRQPATTPADERQIIGMYRGADALEHILPSNATSHMEAKRLKHDVILVLHFLFSPISVQRATGKTPMGTGSAHSIGTVKNFDQGLRMLCKGSMNCGHIVNKLGAVTLTTKSLQA